jgi:hypothetical protein
MNANVNVNESLGRKVGCVTAGEKRSAKCVDLEGEFRVRKYHEQSDDKLLAGAVFSSAVGGGRAGYVGHRQPQALHLTGPIVRRRLFVPARAGAQSGEQFCQPFVLLRPGGDPVGIMARLV